MQQHINLFQPIFRREEKVFSARALVQAVSIALLLLLGGTLLLQVQLAKLSATRDFLNDQHRNLETQVAQLETSADPSALSAMESRIATLEGLLKDGELELDQLRDLMIDRQVGFAALLEALARHPHPGLWLTEINKLNGGLELKGRTYEAELIPRYLDSLSTDPNLTHWSLSTVQLERDPDNAEQLLFTLRAAAAEPPGVEIY